MLAYRLLQAQTQPEFQDVPKPHAGPGQVVVRVAGSGLCHTDFTVISDGSRLRVSQKGCTHSTTTAPALASHAHFQEACSRGPRSCANAMALGSTSPPEL